MSGRVVVRSVVLVLGLVLGTMGGGETGARAQDNQRTQRSFLPSPVVLGMGDAGVALSGIEQGFFYNPAHLPEVASHFTVLGMQGGATASLNDHVQFLNDGLNPVVEDDSRSYETSPALQREADRLRQRPSRGHVGVQLPAFVYSPGAFGVGGGLFAKTATNYRIERGDAAGPSLWALSRTDLMGVLSMGLDLGVVGLEGVSIGVTGTQTRRFLSFKNKSLAELDRREYAVSLEGSTFQLDGGITYRLDALIEMPGTLRVGGAVYDVLEHEWGYAFGGAGRLPFLNDIVEEPSSASDIDADEERQARRQFALDPSYRVGMAYDIAQLFFLKDVGVAWDLQGYGEGRQPLLSRMHLGVQARVVGPLRLRAGFGAGYPSGGVGLDFGGIHVDYALYGVEEGGQFRQRRAYVHTGRVMIRLE